MLVLVRYGEIFLKGNNRKYFENQLVKNIKAQIVVNKVVKKRNRIFVDLEKENLHSLGTVFGIISYSPVVECECSYESVENNILNMRDILPEKTSFRVSCKRSKKIWESSQIIESKVGSFIESNFAWTVDLKNFITNINLEITDKCYLFIDNYKGLGGLPVGVAGNIISNINDNADILASLLMMKRGCRIYAENGSFKKDLLHKYSPFVVYEISTSEDSLNDNNIRAVINSEHISNLTFDKKIHNLPLLRPLLGIDREDVDKKLELYGI